jgi:hypothetical protein
MLPIWVNWITCGVGVWLIISSFLLKYKGCGFWNSLIVGIVVVVLSCLVAIPRKKAKKAKEG